MPNGRSLPWNGQGRGAKTGKGGGKKPKPIDMTGDPYAVQPSRKSALKPKVDLDKVKTALATEARASARPGWLCSSCGNTNERSHN